MDHTEHAGNAGEVKDAENETLPFTPSGFQNYLHGLRQHEMKLGDAVAITHYLQKKAAEDRQFYSAIQLDMKDQITNVFWTDARSKIDYEHFGDVVCFDTSYKINDYGRPFAQFTGVNNHKQIVIFGAALLYDDTMETFKWLFTTFQEAMNGQAPRVILTEEDAAIITAIQEVWPSTTYRPCVWLVYQNAVKNLNHVFQSSPSFETDFSRCVYDYEYEDEFISAWQKMLEEYNLTDHAWLSKMFEDRKKWAVVYGREIFCADMKSTQRTEHMNGVIKTCLNPDKDLLSFFKRYERLVEDRRYNELEADFHAIQSTPEVPLSGLLKQAASIYTPKIYEMFMKEFQLYVACVIKNCGDEGTASVYEVTNVEKQRTTYVRYDLSNDTVVCTCKKFEFVGILCSHALKVLDHKNIKEIPEKYVLKRWRKDAKVGLSINYYDGSSEIDPTVAIASRFTSLGHVYATTAMVSDEAPASPPVDGEGGGEGRGREKEEWEEAEEGEEGDVEEEGYRLGLDDETDLQFVGEDTHGVELYQQLDRLEYESFAQKKHKAIDEQENW